MGRRRIAEPSIPETEHPLAKPSIPGIENKETSIPGIENKETSIPGIENIYVVWKRSLGRECAQLPVLYPAQY